MLHPHRDNRGLVDPPACGIHIIYAPNNDLQSYEISDCWNEIVEALRTSNSSIEEAFSSEGTCVEEMHVSQKPQG